MEKITQKEEEKTSRQMICVGLPGENLVTSGPTLSTIPAPSWPRTSGNGLNFILCSVSYRYSLSVWHTPVVTTCTDMQRVDSSYSLRKWFMTVDHIKK